MTLKRYATTFPHGGMKKREYLYRSKYNAEVKMEDTQTVNYALALKIYQQKGLGRSMKKMRT